MICCQNYSEDGWQFFGKKSPGTARRRYMASQKPLLIFTAPHITQSFMTHDMALMKPYVDIISIDRARHRYGYFYFLFLTTPRYILKLLRTIIQEHGQVVFCYFVDENTFFTAILVRLLRRKLIIATGGWDATYVPDIQFGRMGSWLNRRLFSYTMRLADSVLSFSNSSRDELLRYGKPKRLRTGYMAIDAEQFTPGNHPKLRRVLTVCYTISRKTWVQKGIEFFVRAAAMVPDSEFIVAGRFVDDDFYHAIQSIAPANVEFTCRFLPPADYIALLQSARVYVQASAHEGFGVSLAEGMACGCVPVITDRYAMPEVMGDTGYIVPFNDVPALAQAIQDALLHPERGETARRRVRENFTVQRRQELLRQELEFLIGRKL
ncbi:glycosyltransferase [candidate division KSB3 bacterium]|uniref:Glycosyltransferase n=1 Tax=candidate division KSB3 bacterium TaxID=2044937 RepID=A0A9D5JRJ5_9BACT|nr:glycosyltransferase [candidate division KSB3 bacterium]